MGGLPPTSPNVRKEKWKPLDIQNGSKNWINNSTFLGLSVCRLDTFFPETFGPRYHNRVPFSMFYWMVCLMTTPAVLLPCSLQAPIRHIPSSSPVPAQLLPSFCPVLLYSAQLCSCPIPAQLLPCKCLSTAPALLQPCACPAPRPSNPNFAAFIISTFTFFSTAVSNGFQILEIRFSMKKNPWNQGFQGRKSLKSRFSKQ